MGATAPIFFDLIFDLEEKVDQSEEDFLNRETLSAFIEKYEKIIKQGYKENPPQKKTEERRAHCIS